MKLSVEVIQTPLGPLTLALTSQDALCGVAFEHRRESMWEFIQRRFESSSLAAEATKRRGTAAGEAIQRYFGGEIDALDGIKVDGGGSEFQRSVWAALRLVRGGMTASYSELARGIGKPTGFRAVATANAINPVAIVIPCHRIIHADGSISGYGGGVERKRWLLHHEAENAPFQLS